MYGNPLKLHVFILAKRKLFTTYLSRSLFRLYRCIYSSDIYLLSENNMINSFIKRISIISFTKTEAINRFSPYINRFIY